MVDGVEDCLRWSRQRANIWPLSAATSRSLNTFVTAVSVLWNWRYADCILGINPLLSKNAWICILTIFFSSFEINDKLDTGRKFFSLLSSSPFSSKSGRTTACMNSIGKQPVSKDLLNSKVRKGDKSHMFLTSHEGAGSSWHVLFNADLISFWNSSTVTVAHSLMLSIVQWCRRGGILNSLNLVSKEDSETVSCMGPVVKSGRLSQNTLKRPPQSLSVAFTGCSECSLTPPVVIIIFV